MLSATKYLSYYIHYLQNMGQESHEHTILANFLSPHISSLEKGYVPDQAGAFSNRQDFLKITWFLESVSEIFGPKAQLVNLNQKGCS